jgi:photosystem II stability/assembly factor-like uncharacterized protein
MKTTQLFAWSSNCAVKDWLLATKKSSPGTLKNCSGRIGWVFCVALMSLITGVSLHAQIAGGSALAMNGTNGYATITLGQTLTNYTISAWVYLRSGGVFSNPRIAVVSSTNCGSTAEFLIRGNSSINDPQYLQLGRCFQYEGATSTAPVPMNAWVQVSVSVTNQPAGSSVTFYINGAPAGTELLPPSNNVSLGPTLALAYNNAADRKFDGYLDEVQIWRGVVSPVTNRVLNGAETNLLAYYRFDEGSGTGSGNIAYEGGADNATLQGLATWTIIPPPLPPPGSPTIGGDWIAQGPAPIEDSAHTGGVTGAWGIPPYYPVSGNIFAAVPHPTDSNIFYAAGVNGGVWKTLNAGSSNSISWMPITDQEASPSMTCLEFDPLDLSYQTIVAAHGAYSSSGRAAALLGILRTTNGGVTWQQLSNNLAGATIAAVAARGNTLLAALSTGYPLSTDGLYRSTNAGANFVKLTGASGLPAGQITSLVGNPTNHGRFFAASPSGGIYRSDDTGATWTRVANGITNAASGCGPNTQRVLLGLHANAGIEVVYAAVLNSPSYTPYHYFSTNAGATWILIGVASNSVSTNFANYVHFSYGADPLDPNLVYVGGTGISVWRINRAASLPSRFANLIGYNQTPGRSVHADSHTIKFDPSGNLIQCDDGGIYLLPRLAATSGTHGVTPNGADGWRSLVGNLQLTEFYSIAYDPRGKVLMGGNHDNGIVEQKATGSLYWKIPSGGDGGPCAVDVRSHPTQTTRLLGRDALEYNGWLKRVFNNAGQLLQATSPALICLREHSFLIRRFQNDPLFLRWYYSMEVNAIDGRRVLFGLTNGVFETTDHGETLRRVPGDFFLTVAGARMVYGGSLNGVPNPDLIWACGNKIPSPSYYAIMLRTNATAPLTFINLTNDQPLGIVANPVNWREAYYLTSTKIFQTTNAGQSWVDLTANLAGGPALRTLEFLPLPSGPALAAGTDDGVYITRLGTLPRWWTRLGASLPRAIAYSLSYDPSDQLLAVGMHGRGAWTYSMFGWPEIAGPGVALNLSPAAANFVKARITPALLDNYTISAWINLRSGGTFPDPRVAIVSATNSCPPAAGASVELLIRSATTNITDPQYLQLARCNVFGGPLGTVPVPLNQWVYVAVTVGPTVGVPGGVSNLVSYYVNGQPAGSSYFVNVDLTLGPDLGVGLNNGSNRKFDGLLDQVRIWSTSIDSLQIAATMGAQLTGNMTIDNALVMHLNFNEGTGGAFQAGPGATASMSGLGSWRPSGALFQTVTIPTTVPAQDITSISATLAARYAANYPSALSELQFDYGLTLNYTNFLSQPILPRFTPVLNGSSDFITSTQIVSNPQVFSIGLWFKTTSQNGGRLLGFGSTQTNASPLLDRHLYMGTDGLVRFGVFGDTYRVISGGPACNDGHWHHAMGTFSTNGMRLYLDGIQVAENLTINPGGGHQAFVYDGYWRLGWDGMANWPGASANSFFAGAIAEAQVWDTVLTSNQVSANLLCPASGTEPGLVTYYRLNEAGGVAVADSAPAGGTNAGFVYGAPAWVDSIDIPQCYRQTVTNLEPASTYYFRAVGLNGGSGFGSSDRSFTTMLPTLKVARATNSEVQISWRLPATGFVLEGTSNLNNPSGWLPVLAPADSDASTVLYHITPLPNQSVFYRLRRP